jgi:phosphatidylserine decarboxylase
MPRPFIWLQHSLPQHALSRLTGWLAERERPRWLRQLVLRAFVRRYGVDLAEALPSDLAAFPTFNAFFTRALKPGARPLDDARVVAPVDGRISQLGRCDGDSVLQAKGRHYSLRALLGGDDAAAAPYRGGGFATIYLAPRDYHRVHMPCEGRLVATRYVPGRLFSVNPVTTAGVDRLFARNERLVCHFEGAAGPFAVVLVGAMIVAAIETVWCGRVRRDSGAPLPPRPLTLAQGAELGRFCLGSTVILLFPPDTVTWAAPLRAGATVRMGTALAR